MLILDSIKSPRCSAIVRSDSYRELWSHTWRISFGRIGHFLPFFCEVIGGRRGITDGQEKLEVSIWYS
jgi:hypothetical protein